MHTLPLGLWAWPVNWVCFAFGYLFLLPAFWTLRAKFEYEAYRHEFSVMADLGVLNPKNAAEVQRMTDWAGRMFSGADYFWMSRQKAAEAYFTDVMARLANGERF
jgi:hypothetical protein